MSKAFLEIHSGGFGHFGTVLGDSCIFRESIWIAIFAKLCG
mgnify:CR=1 FL=1